MWCSASQGTCSSSSSGGHRRHEDLLDDQRVAGDRERDLLLLDLQAIEERAHRVDHARMVHDGAVDDGVRGDRLDAEVEELKPAPALLHLGDLDRARSQVQSDAVLRHRRVLPFGQGGAAGGARSSLLRRRRRPSRDLIGFRPSASRIFRFVSIRQGMPRSTRSIGQGREAGSPRELGLRSSSAPSATSGRCSSPWSTDDLLRRSAFASFGVVLALGVRVWRGASIGERMMGSHLLNVKRIHKRYLIK